MADLTGDVHSKPRGRRPGAPRPASTIDAEALTARFHEIGTSVAPVDVLEPALRALVEATGAAAGAICLFDRRQELLRLASEVGLSEEGCRRLRTVRRGDVLAWDMPLHGLLNRRAYLIESAAQNRYVPPLVDSGTPVRHVLCLPVYGGSIPAASVVLVTVGTKSFSERDIRTLDPPLRELAILIEAMRRAASAGGRACDTRPRRRPETRRLEPCAARPRRMERRARMRARNPSPHRWQGLSRNRPACTRSSCGRAERSRASRAGSRS